METLRVKSFFAGDSVVSSSHWIGRYCCKNFVSSKLAPNNRGGEPWHSHWSTETCAWARLFESVQQFVGHCKKLTKAKSRCYSTGQPCSMAWSRKR